MMREGDDLERVDTEAGECGLGGRLLKLVRQRLRAGMWNLGKAHGKRKMELIERLELGGKRQLLLVVCDGRTVLVGAGGDGVQSMLELKGLSDSDTELYRCAASSGPGSEARCR